MLWTELRLKRGSFCVVLASVLALSSGCGDDDDASSTQAGGSAGAAGSSAAGSSGAGASGAGGSLANKVLCGGAYGDDCAEGYYCAYQSGCGTVGHCTRTPTADRCEGKSDTTCGCDGVTYASSCEAALAGVRPNHDGACKPEAEQYACGDFTCDSQSFCNVLKDAKAGGYRYACVELPAECSGVGSCACVGKGACAAIDTCVEEGAKVALTCKY